MAREDERADQGESGGAEERTGDVPPVLGGDRRVGHPDEHDQADRDGDQGQAEEQPRDVAHALLRHGVE